MRLASAADSDEFDDVRVGPYNWYVAITLMLVYTIHYVDRSVINAVLEPIREDFQLSDFELGLLAGPAYSIAFAIAGIPIGLMIDKTNRRNLLATLLGTWSALTFICGFAQNFWMLLVSRMAVGAAEAGGSPTAMSILSDYFPPKQRSTATGIFFISVTLGVFFGYAVTGVVAEQFGWRMAFFVAGIPGLLFVFVVMFTVKEPPRGRYDSKSNQAQKASLKNVLKAMGENKPLLWTVIAIVIAATVTSGFNAFKISLLMRVHGLSLSQAAIIISLCVGIGGGIGSVLWGWLGDQLTKRAVYLMPIMIAVTAAIASSFGSLAIFAPTLTIAVVGIAGFAFFISSFLGCGFGLLLNLSPASVRGSTVAVSQVLINLIGAGSGPVIVGGLSTLFLNLTGQPGLPLALFSLMGLNLVGAMAYIGIAMTLRKPVSDTEAATPSPAQT